MATPTPASIKALLDTGTYPENTISSGNIYDFIRPRKLYPSIEIEMSKPEGKSETQEKTQRGYTFLIHLYYKQLGTGTDEIGKITQIEDQIVILLDTATLGDHKVVNEIFDWTREQPDRKHPFFYMSTLKLIISRVTETTTLIPDGVLKFQVSGSQIENPPIADHTYMNVYDVEISEGFRDIEEMVTSNPDGSHIPVHFASRFAGRFIGNFHLDSADIGTTGEKLNNLKNILANGEKPNSIFIYTNKDSNTPPSIISETINMHIDEITRMYSTNDLTKYRILGKLTKPSTITAT